MAIFMGYVAGLSGYEHRAVFHGEVDITMYVGPFIFSVCLLWTCFFLVKCDYDI